MNDETTADTEWVIRNVVLGRVGNGIARIDVERGLQELRDLRVPGVAMEVFAGFDQRLREGNADFAIFVDLRDEAAYRCYDADPDHHRIRSKSLGPLCSSLERIQLKMPRRRSCT